MDIRTNDTIAACYSLGLERIDGLDGIDMTGARFGGFHETFDSLGIYGILTRYGNAIYRSGRIQRTAVWSGIFLDMDKLIIRDDIATQYVTERIIEGVNRLRRVCALADSGILLYAGKRRRGRPIAGIEWLQWPEELSGVGDESSHHAAEICADGLRYRLEKSEKETSSR